MLWIRSVLSNNSRGGKTDGEPPGTLNEKRASLFGWSLGGLFVLHTMFVHPESFHGYIAMSQSIWLHEKAVLAEFPDFQKRLAEHKIDVNLFLGVGRWRSNFFPLWKSGATTKTSLDMR